MAGFLYFIPGAGGSFTVADARKAGLGYAFEKQIASRGCQRGPGGQAGAIVAAENSVAAGRIGFYRERQTWRPVPGTDAHVGLYVDDSPAPADLVRGAVLPGHLVTLGDGNDWMIPVARALSENEDELEWYSALPHGTGVDEAGNWRRDGVLPRYAALWDVALRWWDSLQGVCEEEGPPAEDPTGETIRVVFDFSGIHDAALLALATNYRISKAEVVLLGLFSDQCILNVLNALVDWPTAAAWLKKKLTVATADGSSIGDGPADGARDTVQA